MYSNRKTDLMNSLVPEFMDPKTFVNNEQIKKHIEDEETYAKMRQNILSKLLKEAKKNQRNK